MNPRPRRFYIETWGCQMNEVDSQRLAGQLMLQGILPTRRAEEADVLLLNSCSVREKAQQKVYSRLGEYRQFKTARPGILIGLCGCVAQQEGRSALERAPHLDFVLGPARVGELLEVIAERRRGQRVVAVGFPAERSFDIDTIAREGTYKGMVTIIEGCDKKCTFCIVPLTRGPERSRPMAEILAEIRHLVDYGFLEIELLGQTVNHWREPAGGADFADLLDAASRIPGVRRLRFVTSYPRDFTPRMIAAVAAHTNISSYLHLPVQSGSDRVLHRMGRGYTIAEYLDLVADLRRARPGLALSTDVIVGFPGESERDFDATLDLVERVRFGSIFAFRYSPRPGTAAPRLSDPVPGDLADHRLQALFRVQEGIQRELNSALVGRIMEVLVTGWSRRDSSSMVGRTDCNRAVNFDVSAALPSAPQPGAIVSVQIDEALPHSLLGSLAGGATTGLASRRSRLVTLAPSAAGRHRESPQQAGTGPMA